MRNKHNALLKGLIWCKSCGRVMTHTFSCKGAKRYRYYVCGTAMQKGWSECPSPSVPAGEIERFVVEQIRLIGSDERLMQKTVEQIESRAKCQLDSLHSERQCLQRQLRNDQERLQAIAANTNDSQRVSGLPELQNRIDVAITRLKQVTAEYQTLKDKAIDVRDVQRLLADFDQLWQAMPPREQVRLTLLLIDRVEFDGVGGNIAITFHDAGLASLVEGDAEVVA